VVLSWPADAGYGVATVAHRVDLERCEVLEPGLLSVAGPTPLATRSTAFVLCGADYVVTTASVLGQELTLADAAHPPHHARLNVQVNCDERRLVWLGIDGAAGPPPSHLAWYALDAGLDAQRVFDTSTVEALAADRDWTVWLEAGAAGSQVRALAQASLVDGGADGPTWLLGQGAALPDSLAVERQHLSWLTDAGAQRSLSLMDLSDGGVAVQPVPADTSAAPLADGLLLHTGKCLRWMAWP